MSATASRPVGLAALAAITLGVAIGCGTTGHSPSGPNAGSAQQPNGASATRDSGSHPVAFADAAGAAQLLPDAPADEGPSGQQRASGAGQKAPTSQPTGFGEEDHRLVQQKDEIVSVLKNGMVVIAKRVPSPVVSVRGYAQAGGVYEGPWLGGGLSHLLEHLVAGGTNQRRTEEQNRDLLQRIGNNSNAYTTEDVTSFFVNTTADNLEPAVDLVTGWMLGARITEAEFQREREVVQRELEMDKGIPDRMFYELANDNRYRVSPKRVPVIGFEPVIQKLKRDDVYTYYKWAYQPNNLVFAVSGNLDPEVLLKAVRNYVDAAPPGRQFPHNIEPEPQVTSSRTMVATFPKLGEARLQVAFPSVRLDSPDLFAMDLLATVLGGGESAQLVEEIRDAKQLVSAIDASDETPSYVDGTFTVSMTLAPEKVGPATEAVLAELEKAKTDGVDEQRLARGKAQMKAARIKRMQTAEDVAESLATDYITTGDPHFSDRYVERIQAVTNDEIKAVAKKYFDRTRLLTTSLLPAEYVGAKGLPKAEEVLRPVVPTTQPGKEQPASPVARVELEDGTVLLTRRISTSPTVTIQLYSLGGVTAEDAKTNGLGNLAMEMLPRGTKTRSAQQISEFFDSIGGDLDTKCGNNSWVWTATCLRDDFAKAFDAYADVVNNPSFPDAELAAMKKRVLAEIAQEDADWTQQALRFFKKAYFGPMNSPYQYLPIGTAENVQGFTADQARDWYTNKVLGSKKVLAVYGDVDPAEAERIVRQHFGKGKKPEAPEAKSARAATPGAAASTPSIVVNQVEVNKTEQALAGIVIGFKADTVIGEPATFPLAVADTMASGYTYPTGYLFDTLRGEGLVYVVDAQNVPGRGKDLPGTFMVYAGCDPKNVNKVVDLILLNIAREQGTDRDVNVDWFKRSKELIVVAEAMENETPAAQAQQAALDELYGLGYDWHRTFADKIRAVPLPDVRNIARERLNTCVVTISTPAPELVKVEKGRREYKSFPPVDLTPRGVQHDTH
jgi:zinc protease